MVEWLTASDPCPECSAMAGVVLKLDEAEGLLPAHPNCRCCYLPANVGEDQDDQIRGREDIEDAMAASGMDPDDIPDIDDERPESLFSPSGDEEDQEDESLEGEELTGNWYRRNPTTLMHSDDIAALDRLLRNGDGK
jgi:hypothetical protein